MINSLNMKKFVAYSALTSLLLGNFLAFFPFVAQAAGASLYFTPSTGNYAVGKTLKVRVGVNSGGGAGINTVGATVKFDPAFLSVTNSNIGIDASIIELWVKKPTVSGGSIVFSGGSSVAYKGGAGTLIDISFKILKAGTTNLSFAAGEVYSADPASLGTNIYTGGGGASYVLTEEKKEEPKPIEKKPEPTTQPKVEEKKTESKGLLPPMPEIESKSHIEVDKWYSNNQPEFSWKLLADLTGVGFLISDKAIDDPGNETDGIIESQKFDAQKDGEQYFHIKLQNRSGWGQVAHRKFKVDVTPPTPFLVKIDNGGDSTNPTPKFVFKTSDKTSGIDYFEIFINNKKEKVAVKDVEKGFYEPQPLTPGTHQLNVVAVDMAENRASSSVSFIIDPLKAPIITSIPTSINRTEELGIRGTSFYKQVTVKIFLSPGNNAEVIERTVKTDDEGNWSFFEKGLSKGVYEVWAKIVDGRGASSVDSTRNMLTVVQPSILQQFGFYLVLALVLVIVSELVYIIYLKKNFAEERNRIKAETTEVKTKLSRIFAALREEVNELIEMADKKPGLSESERRVKEKLQESLDISEEFIAKEVEDVEKEIMLPRR